MASTQFDGEIITMALEQAREEGRREAITRLREQVSDHIACGLPASAEGLLKNVLMMVEETDWPSWLRAQSLTAEQKSGAVMRELIKGAE